MAGRQRPQAVRRKSKEDQVIVGVGLRVVVGAASPRRTQAGTVCPMPEATARQGARHVDRERVEPPFHWNNGSSTRSWCIWMRAFRCNGCVTSETPDPALSPRGLPYFGEDQRQEQRQRRRELLRRDSPEGSSSGSAEKGGSESMEKGKVNALAPTQQVKGNTKEQDSAAATLPQPTEALLQPAKAASVARPWATAAARANPNAWTTFFPETAKERTASLQRWKSIFPHKAKAHLGRVVQPVGAVGTDQSAQTPGTAAHSAAGVAGTEQSAPTPGNASQAAAGVAGAQSVSEEWTKWFPRKESVFSRTPRAIPGRSPQPAESVVAKRPAQTPEIDSQSAAGVAGAGQLAQALPGRLFPPAGAAGSAPGLGGSPGTKPTGLSKSERRRRGKQRRRARLAAEQAAASATGNGIAPSAPATGPATGMTLQGAGVSPPPGASATATAAPRGPAAPAAPTAVATPSAAAPAALPSPSAPAAPATPTAPAVPAALATPASAAGDASGPAHEPCLH